MPKRLAGRRLANVERLEANRFSAHFKLSRADTRTRVLQLWHHNLGRRRGWRTWGQTRVRRPVSLSLSHVHGLSCGDGRAQSQVTIQWSLVECNSPTYHAGLLLAVKHGLVVVAPADPGPAPGLQPCPVGIKARGHGNVRWVP